MKNETATATESFQDKLQDENQPSKKVSAGNGRTRSTKRVAAAKQVIANKPIVAKRVPVVAAPPGTVAEVLAEVKRAVDELAAGKSVPAYERLRKMLDAQDADATV